jgi:putative redox protein
VTPRPATIVDLVWIDGLKFSTVSSPHVIIDSAGAVGPSPVEALGLALAGCMSVDVAHILSRGRRPLLAMRSRFVGNRADEDPHRFLHIALHFTIEGAVPARAVERAIQLSREKYCSVWHSMRQDIDLRVTFELVP